MKIVFPPLASVRHRLHLREPFAYTSVADVLKADLGSNWSAMQDDLIKRAMALHMEDASDASTIASAATSLMQSLYDELGSLVGAQAASALCVHALHRTRSTLHWTLPPTAAIDGTTLLALRTDLAARTPPEALSASTTLLVALVGHLITLIGKSLIDRMLSSAWNLPVGEENMRENFND